MALQLTSKARASALTKIVLTAGVAIAASVGLDLGISDDDVAAVAIAVGVVITLIDGAAQWIKRENRPAPSARDTIRDQVRAEVIREMDDV